MNLYGCCSRVLSFSGGQTPETKGMEKRAVKGRGEKKRVSATGKEFLLQKKPAPRITVGVDRKEVSGRRGQLETKKTKGGNFYFEGELQCHAGGKRDSGSTRWERNPKGGKELRKKNRGIYRHPEVT